MKPTHSCEVYIDGASRGNPGPAGVGVVFMDDHAKPVRKFSKYIGETTNNVAEYLALLYALQEALRYGYPSLAVKPDSQLLARQGNGQYKVRDPQLRLFHDLVLHLIRAFRSCTVEHVPRTQNQLADHLAGQSVQGRTRDVSHLL